MRASMSTCGGRPVSILDGGPLRKGSWTVYYGDNCWIPDETFGYVTHHYGSWVYIVSFRSWYWTPRLRAVAAISQYSPSASAGIPDGSVGSIAALL